MQQPNWYVITGGPSTGKTTLISVLEKLGHKVIPEAAKLVIDEGMAKGLSVKQIRADEKQFQHTVLWRKADTHAKHDLSLLTFFDRGMHDTMAYARFYGLEIDKEIKRLMEKTKYKKVFLLNPLPTFTRDYMRTEDHDFTKRIHELLFQAYEESGHTPIIVPVMTPQERAQFVLQHLEQEA